MMRVEVEKRVVAQVKGASRGVACSTSTSRRSLVPRLWLLLLPYAYLINVGTGFVQLTPASSSLVPARSVDVESSMEFCCRGRRIRSAVYESKTSKQSALGATRGQLRSCASKLYVEAHGDHHADHGHNYPRGVMRAATTLPIEREGKKTSNKKEFVLPTPDHGGHDGRGGVSGGGRSGGGGDGEGEGDGAGDQGGAEEVDVAATGRRKDKISRKVDKAVRKGSVPKEYSSAYAELLKSPAMALLCKNDGWRARLLGDTNFMTKLGIELVTGTGAQALAEYQKRGEKFVRELDLVMADTLTSLFANFAAVWLSCPTVAVRVSKRGAAKAGGALQKFFGSCPSNAFQSVSKSATGVGASKGYSLYQRGGALLTPMPKLFAIGFGATIAGYGLVAALDVVRRKGRGEEGAAGESGEAEDAAVPVLGSGLAIGVFLAVSTNVRYQFIAGALEQRVFDKMRPGVSRLASTALRSGNLYFGSLTIVDWLRFVGLQSS